MKPSAGCRRGDSNEVAGKMLGHELVKREVDVERANHIIAVAERVHDIVVELMSGCFGVTDQVEPVPGPPLAVAAGWPGAGRQVVHKRRPRRSARNAATTSGAGGKPVRSKLRRRIKVRRSASGAGVSPCSASAA